MEILTVAWLFSTFLNCKFLYLWRKIIIMAETTNSQNSKEKKSKAVYWLMTLVTTAACIFLVIFYSQFFWIMLPFVFTSLMLALDYL